MKVDHVGIAVRSLDEAMRLYADVLGLAAEERYELPDEGVRLVFLRAGHVLLELLEPIGDTGPIARFLSSQGEGLHHIAFLVEDIHQALAQAKAAGCRPIDEHPRLGARGRLIAFLHPSSTRGVLIEFVQDVERTPGATS